VLWFHCVRSLQLERSLLPEALRETGRYSLEAVEHEAEGVMENRLQNLAITIDKINLFLRHQSKASQKVPYPFQIHSIELKFHPLEGKYTYTLLSRGIRQGI
jgi:hypothetical protein